uniref:SNRPN upstream reading frame protein isoform X1 n=1 Tax=Myodes glareolus TaxID=447135 RepID=UPI00202223E2|nr:SNRPN upstream reading frame protein isoform X1 [Myodes glareolus]
MSRSMTAAQCWGEGSRVRDARHWGKDALLPGLRHGFGGGEQQGPRLRHWGEDELVLRSEAAALTGRKMRRTPDCGIAYT